MIIYKITNKKNGKSYIGQTIRNLDKRIKAHLSKSNKCWAIGKALKKYGIENFEIETIDLCDNLKDLNKKETEWIEKLETLHPKGYNLSLGGCNKKYSKVSKNKMSKSHKGKKLSKEHKENISKFVKKVFQEDPQKKQKGRIKAAKSFIKWCKKNGHPKKGKKISEESKKRISDAKKGSKNPMFGKSVNKNQKDILLAGQQKRIKNLPQVLCHQNGKIYRTVTEVAKDLGVARSSVSNVLIGFRKNLKGYTFEYIKRDLNET